MAFIIFSFIVPVSVAEVKLSRYMELTADQNVFAINFFNTLRDPMKGCKPLMKSSIERYMQSKRIIRISD